MTTQRNKYPVPPKPTQVLPEGKRWVWTQRTNFYGGRTSWMWMYEDDPNAPQLPPMTDEQRKDYFEAQGGFPGAAFGIALITSMFIFPICLSVLQNSKSVQSGASYTSMEYRNDQ